MKRGLKNQLTKQAGEYLVAAELCRRGLVCTTFTGNMPDYDIIAVDGEGKHIPVQVKAIRSSSWQLSVDAFAEVRMKGEQQFLGEKHLEPCVGLICVFVVLSSYGHDRFFILRWESLGDIIIEHHQTYLERHGNIRSRNPQSKHVAVRPSQIAQYADNWELIAGEHKP